MICVRRIQTLRHGEPYDTHLRDGVSGPLLMTYSDRACTTRTR